MSVLTGSNSAPVAPVITKRSTVAPWVHIANEAQSLRDASIPQEWILNDLPSPGVVNVTQIPYTCGILSQQELEWTDQDATSLLRHLREGTLKSYDLTLAFCKRAAIAHQLVSESA
jgi:amidase